MSDQSRVEATLGQMFRDHFFDDTYPEDTTECCVEEFLATLRENRIALVELPEPNSTRYEDEDDEFPPADRLAWWYPGSLFGISQWGYPNEVQIAYNGEPFEPVNIIEARFIAAALLAAAAAAEVTE
ncbi:hypothetical protein PBI_ESTAVE1_66 [Mycobacterium phage Estave1]|uniref:Uncharacterized protein n=1 Tax=Mycobacterium phage Estave1 TaxID=1536603 RepID=A0A088FA55_9CAUD|nr:DNA methyltransferase [Mycobacterium phage Estave1]AIM40456.1 hypothetical protein PBI_ESTAVE1_66 [Mycobacterium phage Estave1]